MRADLTDITLIVDRSGSMEACQHEAQKGINAFVEDQRGKPGVVLLSILQFDTEHEYVAKAKPIEQVEPYRLVPRGMTALLDAVGKAIKETGERLEKTAESERPGLVVVAIVTDGQENSSHEFRRDQIKKMIEHQQSAYQWQFTFLGANQDAFAEAGAMGIPMQSAANYCVANVGAAYASLSHNVARMRSACINGATPTSSYTTEERNEMN